MTQEKGPVVGRWYHRRGEAQAFQVVAVDALDGTVELQYFDGTLDELRLPQWHGLDLEDCEAPQDWTGAYDGIVREDAGESGADDSAWAEPESAATDAAAAPEAADEDSVSQDPALLAPDMVEPAPAKELLYARPAPRKRRRR